ncbi:MAG: hypothetical protein AB7E72_06835 [Lysobacterales bacterium]
MSKLQTELHRLYLPKEAAERQARTTESALIDQDGMVRAMVMELARPADWEALDLVWRGVQSDLELPAPAIAVSGTDGFQLWFSLAEPVAVGKAQAFLESLRLRYWADIASKRLRLLPAADPEQPGQARHADLVPGPKPGTGYWSAFVSPDLAPMFAETPWMDIAPGDDGQAAVLRRLVSISPTAFAVALKQLQAPAPGTPAEEAPSASSSEAGQPGDPAETASGQLSPRQFLLQVMNDERAPLALRVEAAKALLP